MFVVDSPPTMDVTERGVRIHLRNLVGLRLSANAIVTSVTRTPVSSMVGGPSLLLSILELQEIFYQSYIILRTEQVRSGREMPAWVVVPTCRRCDDPGACTSVCGAPFPRARFVALVSLAGD